jgi:hypothetical protein
VEEALYLREPGNAARIMAGDIHQEQIGDCGLLAVLGELAIKDPTYISQHLIEPNADGTETVTLYNNPWGGQVDFNTTSFAPISFDISNDFPTDSVNSFSTDSVAHGVKEIWPQVLEKAYAFDQGGYDVIRQGVYDALAMETFTGHHASWEFTADTTLAHLRNQIDRFAASSSALVTFDTPDATGAMPYNLIADHAYMLEGVEVKRGHTFVELLNPWGTHEPSLIPVSAIAANFDTINFGRL